MGRPKRGAAAKSEAQEETKKAKSGLAVGDQLPEFELETDEEKTLSSANMVKDSGIILFCYPKANTKGCTSQAIGLCEKSKELAEAGFKVYGISADKAQSQANWKNKEDGITCTLLCDPSQEVLGKLGFLKGKKINRSHIVVEKGGKVLDVQYGITPKNSVKDGVEFCLEHKGEPAAAEQAEEAAAAGEEAEAAAEQQEGPKEEAGTEAQAEPEAAPAAEEKPEGDNAEAEPAPAAEEKKDEPTPMETEEAPAAEAPAAEEEKKEADEPKPEEQQQEKPAEEAPAAAEPAAEVQQEAQAKPAEEEPAEEEAPAAEPGAAEASKEESAPASEEPAAPAAPAEAAA